MFKSNRSFMSISKRGSELCSQLALYFIIILQWWVRRFYEYTWGCYYSHKTSGHTYLLCYVLGLCLHMIYYSYMYDFVKNMYILILSMKLCIGITNTWKCIFFNYLLVLVKGV